MPAARPNQSKATRARIVKEHRPLRDVEVADGADAAIKEGERVVQSRAKCRNILKAPLRACLGIHRSTITTSK